MIESGRGWRMRNKILSLRQGLLNLWSNCITESVTTIIFEGGTNRLLRRSIEFQRQQRLYTGYTTKYWNVANWRSKGRILF